MRMAELARRSGVTRETIHFYLREGLLPRPEKGGMTVAFYGEEHLERLRIIRRLREEKYLPIAVIRRLIQSPAAAARDVDVLADVLHIIPLDEEPAQPSPDAIAEAEGRKLLGPRSRVPLGTDPAERRVLHVVEEALALEGDARRLTLDDLEACASSLSALVAREAELVFDAMFGSGDVGGAVGALRSGRPAVAHFIAAYRDLMLRRIVEDVLLALEQGHDLVLRAATIPLSPEREAALGVPERRAHLWEAARGGDEAAVARLVWHLFGTGASAELASLPPAIVARAGARLAPLVAYGALEHARSATTLGALDRAVATALDFPLGQILLGEAIVARGLGKRHGGASVLEQAVPALHRVFVADPDADAEPVARAYGWFHRGRVELALPPVLGRTGRGLASLEKALGAVEAYPELEPAARARIRANALLALGRHFLSNGEVARGTSLLQQAAAEDPSGPVSRAVREETAQGTKPERSSA
jgi:DNA-binding transcriptional MerR regulator